MRDLARWIFGFCASVLLVDLAFFGPGLALPGVPFSIRRVMFLGILASAAALRLMSRQSVTRAELSLVMAMLTLVVGWAVIIPFVNGFKLGHAVADVSPWIALLLVALWPWREWYPRLNWASVRRMVHVLGLILAGAHVVLWGLLVTEVISPTAFYFAAEALSAPTARATHTSASPKPRPGSEFSGRRRYFFSAVSIFCWLTGRVSGARAGCCRCCSFVSGFGQRRSARSSDLC